jgi:signal transduction histidine kinase/DNA-binding response OmpR family regulator
MSKPIRIVILEDVPTDAELIERSLRRDGIDATIELVADRNAFERAMSGDPPDLFLSDYNLPDLTGMEAFEIAHRAHPTVPFIIVTASIDEETAVQCMKLGVNDYVLKEQLVRLGPAVRGALELRDREEARRRSEEAVRERDALLQGMLRSLPDRIAVLSKDGNIVTINETWRHFAEGIGGPFPGENYLVACDQAGPDSDRHGRIDSNGVRAVLDGRAPLFEQEYHCHSESGDSLWFVMTVAALDTPGGGAIVSHHNVTRIRAAEERSRFLETRYRRFFEEDFAADFLATPQGEILDCNPAFIALFEVPNEGLAQALNLSLFLIDERDWPELIEALGNHGKLEHHRIPMRTYTGREVRVVGNVIGTSGATGLLEEVRGYFIDETALKDLEGQFLQAQKMEAIGQLTGGIAHDFNNLLSAILGYADFAITELGENHAVSDDLLMIRRAGERAAALTRQLLVFSRRQVVQPVVLDVNYTIRELEKMLRRLIGENIDFVTVLSESLGKVKADAGQLEQVIVNLAVNARDAMPDGGRFTIETLNVDLGHNYARENLLVKPGPYIAITLSDSGCGIDEATKERIFEPFFTTKPEGKGTGLGLSTVYGIVKQSGGNVTVYSEPGKGTTFRVYLPRIDQEADRIVETPPHEMSVAGTETILLVEDDDGVRNLSNRILSQRGYTVLESRTGDGAVRISECYEHEIHLLLTDIVVPGLGGPEVAETLQRQRPNIRVMFMSGYTGTAALFQGPVGRKAVFVQKPFTPETLCKQVRRALDTTPT